MFFLEMTTIPDPFCVDVSDPKFKRLIDHTTSSIQTRRPTHAEVKKKLVNINARLDKNRIMFDKLKEEIPEMMVEVLIWEKYLQHKEAQDQEKSEQKNEEDALRNAQLELDAKKRELKGRKSVKVVRNMLLTEPTDLLLRRRALHRPQSRQPESCQREGANLCERSDGRVTRCGCRPLRQHR